jgi:hypothetical protein
LQRQPRLTPQLAQVAELRKKLFPAGVESEALRSLAGRLSELRRLAASDGGAQARRDAAASGVERLLRSAGGPAPTTVFIKTFQRPRAESLGKVAHEIDVCRSRHPDLGHDNVCCVSRASFGAPVETRLPGHGWVGLLARLPFVAMEDCDGVDLFDLFGRGALEMPRKLQRLAGAAGAGAVNDMLRAAADFRARALEHLDRARRELKEENHAVFVRGLALLAVRRAEVARTQAARERAEAEAEAEAVAVGDGGKRGRQQQESERGSEEGSEGGSEGGATAGVDTAQGADSDAMVTDSFGAGEAAAMLETSRAPWSDMCSLAALDGLPFPYCSLSGFKSLGAVKGWLNRLVDKVHGNRSEKALLCINRKRWAYQLKTESGETTLEYDVMQAAGRRILAGLSAIDNPNPQDPARWGAALFAVWPDLEEFAALDGLQHVLALAVDWRWQAVASALRAAGIRAGSETFAPRDAVGGAGGCERRREVALALATIGVEHAAARARLLHRIYAVAPGESDGGLYLGPDRGRGGRLARVSAGILAHAVASRSARLHGLHLVGEEDRPGRQGVDAARAVFKQAVQAVQRLHGSGGGGRVHGDVKTNNFNLTAQGLVKLLDFGFMLDLGEARPGPVHVLTYSSPQVGVDSAREARGLGSVR